MQSRCLDTGQNFSGLAVSRCSLRLLALRQVLLQLGRIYTVLLQKGGSGTLIERLHVSAALVLHAMVRHCKTSGPGSSEAFWEAGP